MSLDQKPRAPYAYVAFAAASRQPDFNAALARIPGVKPKDTRWVVPLNALSAVGDVAGRYQAQLVNATWISPPSAASAWPDIRAALVVSGEVRDWVLAGFLKPYQEQAITYGWSRPGVHYWHGTGSGKTLTGILTALATPGPIIVVTRAAARLQIAREIARFTNLDPYVMRPDTERRGLLEVNGETWVMFFTRMMPELKTAARIAEAWKDYKARHGVLVRRGATLSQYLQARSAAGARPVVVLGWESLTVHCAKLKALNPAVLLFDESHNLSSSKRYEFVLLPELPGDPVEAHAMLLQQQNEAKEAGGFIREDDGGRKLFVPYRSAASTAAELARHPSVKRRIALTATPLRNRVRDLYSPLDFIEPNCWGNTTAWMDRYADRKPARYGSGFDTAGASNMEELKTRLAAVAHILTYKETHSQLPPKRRQSFYVAPEDQVKPTGGFSQEHKAALHRGPSAVLEVGLAEAASRKRAAVMGIVEDHLSSGQKVVVFTGRRKDCEILGKSVEALTCVKRDGARVWCTHGEDSSKQRDAFVQEYMAHRGAGCFVSTGHSCGESINLDDTDAALMVQLPWTPDKLRQWEGRFHRASTTRPVLIYYVIAEGTVDEHMAAILIDKLPAVAEVVHDDELASAGSALAGLDTAVSDEEFARSVLADLDWA